MSTGQQQLYSLVYCTVGGALLTEEVSVELRRITNAQVINTIQSGFAGMSQGAAFCSIDVKNAVPSVAFELDPGPFMRNLGTVEMMLFAASVVAVTKGYIVEDTLVHGVDSPSGLSFKFIGRMPQWEKNVSA